MKGSSAATIASKTKHSQPLLHSSLAAALASLRAEQDEPPFAGLTLQDTLTPDVACGRPGTSSFSCSLYFSSLLRYG